MTSTDTLLAESQRLRDELMRTAARLDAFCEQLTIAVGEMGGSDDGNGPGNTGAGEGRRRVDAAD